MGKSYEVNIRKKVNKLLMLLWETDQLQFTK